MLSRSRSTCGVRPYVRGTCNPDPDSFLASFLAWWIEQETGYPIAERAGRMRWFVRADNAIAWGDTPEELLAQYPQQRPKSVSFHPGTLADNAILEAKDPGYRANLMAMPLVERERLLGGNWKIRPAAGNVFKRHWFRLVDAAPIVARRVRAWDKAATDADGDWTAGVRMALTPDARVYVEDVKRVQLAPGGRDALIRQTAELDGFGVEQVGEQEPGAAGKSDALAFVMLLAGYTAHTMRPTGNKVVRAGPLASQAEAGNVSLVRGDWNEVYLTELERFPSTGVPDDQVDASSAAYNRLAGDIRELDSSLYPVLRF
jgi:predicted phage terminase large subunit-like protein